MKVKVATGILCVAIIMICFNAVHAQTGYLPGYVVMLNGDTLHGRVMDRDDGTFPALYKKIRFINEKGKKRKYSSEDLLGYKRGEDHFISLWIFSERRRLVERYYSLPGKGEMHFVRVIHRGHLDYYHWEYIDGEFSTFEFVPLFKRPGSPEMVRVTQGVLGLKKKRLSEFFADCPALVSAINDNQITTPEAIISFRECH